MLFRSLSQTTWHAPCTASPGLDICGCRSDLNEGWNHVEQRCAKGGPSDEHTERGCAETHTSDQSSPSGCPAGSVTLGFHYDAPLEVGCIRFLQSDAPQLMTSEVKLEAWGAGGWSEVKSFQGLRGGSWQTLRTRDSCAPYTLPATAPSWTEVVGNSGPAVHGDSVTVRCAVGTMQAIVTCVDGRWDQLPPLVCSAPSMDIDISSRAPQKSEKMSPEMDLALKVGGAIFGVLALIGGLNLLAIYLKRQAWRRLVVEGAKPPPEVRKQQIGRAHV